MNKTIATGNLGSDAEIIQTEKFKFLSFSVAVKLSKDSTLWYKCSINNERLITSDLPKYLKKGVKVLIEGVYSPKIYTTKDDKSAIDHAFYVNHIELMGAVNQQPTQSNSQQSESSNQSEDDDLPF